MRNVLIDVVRLLREEVILNQDPRYGDRHSDALPPDSEGFLTVWRRKAIII